jgi:hypothetical protein
VCSSLGKEDHEFKSSLGYVLRSQNSKTKTKKEGRMRITVSALSGYDKV